MVSVGFVITINTTVCAFILVLSSQFVGLYNYNRFSTFNDTYYCTRIVQKDTNLMAC